MTYCLLLYYNDYFHLHDTGKVNGHGKGIWTDDPKTTFSSLLEMCSKLSTLSAHA